MSKKSKANKENNASKKEQVNADKWQDVEEQEVVQEQDAAENNKSAGVKNTGSSAADNAQVEVLKSRVKELEDQVLYTKAEMNNVRQRSERDVSNAHRYGNEKIIKELLPILDSLQRGLQESAAIDGDALREGVSLTLDMFKRMLEKSGVEFIHPAVGDAFNPEVHEAMSMQQDPKAESNTILQVLQDGYSLHGRVIRAAMVIVNQ